MNTTKSNKNIIIASIFGLAIIIAAYLLGDAYIQRSNPSGSVEVTGLGETNFTSDLIVWDGSFSRTSTDLSSAYSSLERDKQIITSYLTSKGIAPEELIFNAVQSREETESKYSDDGKYIGNRFLGYTLTQSLQVKSKNVEKVEKISREITELLNRGIGFYSQPPRYYYTKLADLKIELISKATADAKLRADMIAENSKGRLGDLISAKMGVFQITGQNSGEDYSWGGTFNTADKDKTASITVKLNYRIK
ncbi:hypothetical protein C7377_0852 [Balneicella halophila]|uniref:SIMPL domain-containing protein n=1 Tax=Balneicella halophila TaxID=1537566 RepID=A0A7L4URX6_BALHA|nr:SIMPL domain-containing protein [Balneicella halophila]PVX52528.1 hypothetical protein C7377_0852 [Balneicella halophila]